MPRQPKEKKPLTSAKYEPTRREAAVISKFQSRRTVQAPRIKLAEDDGIRRLSLDHPDTQTASMLLMEALGTTDLDFVTDFLSQIVHVSEHGGEAAEERINFIVSVIKGIEPRDQVEAMLAAQMAAVHISTMTFARRLSHVENIPQQDSAEKAFNKLSRTFAAQMETLKRYRTGGEQKVTVQHVTVGEGGQAIVGNVTQSQREAGQDKSSSSTLAITDAKTSPMPTIEAEGKPTVVVPRTSKKK